MSTLCALVGALIGFAVTSLPHRHASAQMPFREALTNAAPQSSFSASATRETPTINVAATTGVGGTFVTEVYREVSPAVVHITNRSVAFDFFLRPYSSESTGSGVIVDATGYILTNHHVIAGAEEVLVILNDGREFEAEIVGADPGTDLALLRVETDVPLPTARLGDSSQIEVGEWVVAIGNPRGYDWTVTTGVISALGREVVSITGQTMRGLIQTDASINPGNSGGPLLNVQGEVIGINELIVSSSGGSEGIGLAIPINTAKVVLDDLVQYGRVIRAWLGTRVYEEINDYKARRYNLPVDYGVVLGQVFPDSPASRGGLKGYTSNRRTREFSYDIITAVDDERVDSERKLLDLIREREPGDYAKIGIYRVENGRHEVMELEVKLEALPPEAPLMGVI